MRLVGTIHVIVQGSVVERDPTTWEKLKQRLGGRVDLETDRVKVELEATALVNDVKRALARLQITNALSLVIDGTVLYQDAEGRRDDLGDLLIALSEHDAVFGRGFRELRFAAEHEEAGLHLVVETRAYTEHGRDQPSAIISIGGRLRELEPRPGEEAEAYRARVEPLAGRTAMFEAARLQFESFVGRLEAALQTALPSARVEQQRAEARLVRAAPRDVARGERPPTEPTHPGYDPFPLYHPPGPASFMLDVMLMSAFMHALHPPALVMMSPGGAPLGAGGGEGNNDDRDGGGEGDAQAADHEAWADGGSDGDEADSPDDFGDDSGGGWGDGGGFDDS